MKDSLLSLVEQAHAEERLLASRLTAEEIAYDGTPEKWAGRDMLAHCAFWKQDVADNLKRVRNGEAVVVDEDYIQTNDKIFVKYHPQSLEEILAFGDQAAAALAEEVGRLDEETLLATGHPLAQEGQAFWRALAGTAYIHPVIHLIDFYVKRGDISNAAALHDISARQLGALDDSPAWRGTIRYNLACLYSLAGQKELAIQTLREALQMNPGLAEWSKQDPDFAPIRDEAEFQAVYDL
jgi:tetratricopeptide (TPR) repeat protein